jgi:hypothetical protein
MKKVTLVLGLLISSWVAAQPFEQFNFTGAANANGWTTHSGTSGQLQAITTPSNNGSSLSFPALENSVGNRIQLTAGNNEDVNKALSNITGVGYYSFLLNVPTTAGLHANGGNGDYFIGFGGAAGGTVTSLAGRVFVKAGLTPNTFVLGLLNQSGTGNATSYLPTEYPVGTTVFIVVKLDATVSPINASIWVNPTPGTPETPADLSNNTGSNGLASFASIFLRQGGNAGAGTGNVEVDEIRAGATWYQVTPCNTPTIYYTDFDGDGFGDMNLPVLSCLPFPGLVLDNTDCNDTSALINPNTMWYADADGDGFGDAVMTTTSCYQPIGYVANSTDCNDNDSTATVVMTYYQDFDGDGFGNVGAPIMNCGQPTGYVADSSDCDDSNPTVYPGAVELCDELDNNCDGNTDEGLATYTLFEDMDSDGFGSEVSVEYCDSVAVGYSLVSGDCNDTVSTIYPGAMEVLDNNIDEDCDGVDGTLYLQENVVLETIISPNPSNGAFIIRFNTSVNDGILNLTDINGKLILSKQITGLSYEINDITLKKGIYFLTITSSIGTARQRVIIN